MFLEKKVLIKKKECSDNTAEIVSKTDIYFI